MSNFFGALDSDDDEPSKVVAKTTTTAAASGAKADAGARLTGADKKNRDQKRHGATRGAKEGEAPKKHGGFDRKSGAGRYVYSTFHHGPGMGVHPMALIHLLWCKRSVLHTYTTSRHLTFIPLVPFPFPSLLVLLLL